MFDHFTDHARKMLSLARQASEKFECDCIDTEHILIGLTQINEGVAHTIVTGTGIDMRELQRKTEERVKRGNSSTIGQLPFTNRSKKVLEYSIDEARALNHNYVGSEHLLLGLLREENGLARKVLDESGLKLEDARARVTAFLSARDDDANTPRKSAHAKNKDYALELLGQALELCDDEKELAAFAKKLDRVRGKANERIINRFVQNAAGEMNLLGDEIPNLEHYLLAILHQPDSVAARVLMAHGIELDQLRKEILILRNLPQPD